jgi:hypothetical protein
MTTKTAARARWKAVERSSSAQAAARTGRPGGIYDARRRHARETEAVAVRKRAFGGRSQLAAVSWRARYPRGWAKKERSLSRHSPVDSVAGNGTAAPALADQGFREVVEQLSVLLGRKLTALLAGVRTTSEVEAWASGAAAPTHVRVTLRIALRAAQIVASQDGPRTAQTWFQGRNRHLGGRSPARVLRESEPEVAATELLSAARAFRTAAG